MTQEKEIPGRGFVESVTDWYNAFIDLEESDESEIEFDGSTCTEDDLRDRAYEWPLSIMVRDGWRSLGQPTEEGPEEFELLMSTGGPAVRIYGKLSEHGEVESFEVQGQDWFKPWTNLPLTEDEREAVSFFVHMFHFSE